MMGKVTTVKLPVAVELGLYAKLRGYPLSDILCGILFYYPEQMFRLSCLETLLYQLQRVAPHTFRPREIADLINILGNLEFSRILFNHYVNGTPDHYEILPGLRGRQQLFEDRGIIPHHEVVFRGLAVRLWDLHNHG